MRVKEWVKEDRDFSRQDYRETSYSVGELGGERMFQIQTRSAKGAVTQTIQFDRTRAQELAEILKKEFDL